MVRRSHRVDTGAVRRTAIALLATLALAACGTPSPTSTPTTSPATRTARLFWVADTGTSIKLFREDARVAATPTPGLTALRYLVAHHPIDPDYSTLWPAGNVVNDVTIDGTEATVDLGTPHLNVGSEAEGMAIQQLLWTLLAAEPSVRSMRLTVNGQPMESLAGHVDATQAFTRPPAYEVVAQVWMLDPIDGSSLSGNSVTLRGMACTFEANVAWAIRQGTSTVRSGSTTAAEACPAWSPWSVTVAGLAPGEYTASAAEYSAKDGSLVVQDTKRFTLR